MAQTVRDWQQAKIRVAIWTGNLKQEAEGNLPGLFQIQAKLRLILSDYSRS